MSTDATAAWAIQPKDFPIEAGLPAQLHFLLGYAILAPSGHNTQPWLFEVGESHIDIFADRSRALPVVDPEDRELTISCGAALGMLEIAARRFSLIMRLAFQPTAHDRAHLARAHFTTGKATSPADMAVFDAIIARRTDRRLFRLDPLPEGFAPSCAEAGKALGVDIRIIEDDEQRRAIAGLIAQGDRIQFDDPKFRKELADWVHSKTLGNHDGMSGAAFGMPDILSAAGGLAIRTFDMGNGIAAADEDKVMFGSPTLMLLAADETVVGWLNTGRVLAMISLLATQHGLGHSYLNQPIEIGTLRQILGGIAQADQKSQILLRLGYPGTDQPLAPAARRPVAEVLRSIPA